MKLLICTQKVAQDDPILGFFHRWIEEFAKRFEFVTVICLFEGSHNLPSNVKVLSLGKEEGVSRTKYLRRFYKYIWQERQNYDAVFVHMNPEHLLLGGVFWRLIGKSISLWYVHKSVDVKLWLAEKLTHRIFTSTPKSFKLQSKKILYVGHGIDTDRFKFRAHRSETLRVIYVGRISRIKNIEKIIEGIGNLPLTIVGDTKSLEDELYKKELQSMARGPNSKVEFVGEVKNDNLPELFYSHSLSVNASPDGGMDKAVLESLSCGTPALIRNQSFKQIYQEHFGKFHFNSISELKDKVKSIVGDEETRIISKTLSDRVNEYYSVESLVQRLVNKMYI